MRGRGSIASSLQGEPRVTNDIDFVVARCGFGTACAGFGVGSEIFGCVGGKTGGGGTARPRVG